MQPNRGLFNHRYSSAKEINWVKLIEVLKGETETAPGTRNFNTRPRNYERSSNSQAENEHFHGIQSKRTTDRRFILESNQEKEKPNEEGHSSNASNRKTTEEAKSNPKKKVPAKWNMEESPEKQDAGEIEGSKDKNGGREEQPEPKRQWEREGQRRHEYEGGRGGYKGRYRGDRRDFENTETGHGYKNSKKDEWIEKPKERKEYMEAKVIQEKKENQLEDSKPSQIERENQRPESHNGKEEPLKEGKHVVEHKESPERKGYGAFREPKEHQEGVNAKREMDQKERSSVNWKTEGARVPLWKEEPKKSEDAPSKLKQGNEQNEKEEHPVRHFYNSEKDKKAGILHANPTQNEIDKKPENSQKDAVPSNSGPSKTEGKPTAKDQKEQPVATNKNEETKGNLSLQANQQAQDFHRLFAHDPVVNHSLPSQIQQKNQNDVSNQLPPSQNAQSTPLPSNNPVPSNFGNDFLGEITRNSIMKQRLPNELPPLQVKEQHIPAMFKKKIPQQGLGQPALPEKKLFGPANPQIPPVIDSHFSLLNEISIAPKPQAPLISEKPVPGSHAPYHQTSHSLLEVLANQTPVTSFEKSQVFPFLSESHETPQKPIEIPAQLVQETQETKTNQIDPSRTPLVPLTNHSFILGLLHKQTKSITKNGQWMKANHLLLRTLTESSHL